MVAKNIIGIYKSGSTHWVGDGFHVRNLFPSNDLDEQISPFLLLDYAGPSFFPPSTQSHGVGEHPHRGFETVTIVYQGSVAHRDSAGNRGVIGPGDVQWMTAASGIVHEEMHEKAFAQHGGMMEMVQLWVNLPKEHKMSSPRYQTILDSDIPRVALADESGTLRIIAGKFSEKSGPAKTFTPINLYDVRLKAGRSTAVLFPRGTTTAIFLLKGSITLNGTQSLHEAQSALFDLEGEHISITANEEAALLILNGEPIKEPIARYGPFVMNTREEIVAATRDYQAGKMGHL